MAFLCVWDRGAVIPIIPPVPIANQITPSGALPYVQQMNFGAMIGQVSSFNPNALPQIPNWINYIARKIFDMKTWYGTWRKGQIVCPAQISGGTAMVTYNSPIVQGINTTWDSTVIGRQFRTGLNNPIYTIINVDPFAQQLILELPWAGPLPPSQNTQTTGYNIVQMYYMIGQNIKYIKTVVNKQLGYKMRLNWTQGLLDTIDPWRIWVNFPCALAPLPTDPNGNYLLEMWPAPFTQQALPYTAYVQPPNLVDDLDTLPPYIRCDIVIKEAICWALRYKPKLNPGYDPQTALAVAQQMHGEFMADLESMWNADENLYRTSTTIELEDYPDFMPGGNLYAAMHAVLGDSLGNWL